MRETMSHQTSEVERLTADLGRSLQETLGGNLSSAVFLESGNFTFRVISENPLGDQHIVEIDTAYDGEEFYVGVQVNKTNAIETVREVLDRGNYGLANVAAYDHNQIPI